MRRLGRVLLRIVVAAAIVVAVSLLTALLIFRSGWFREKVRERIITEVENATGARVDVGSFTFDSTHLVATVSEFVMHGKEPAGEAPLLTVKSITVGLRILSMLEHKVDLASLRLEQPYFHIIFYSDGSNNFPPPHNINWAGLLIDAAIRRYQVDDGIVEYDDHKLPLSLRGENLRASMSYEARTPLYRGELSTRRIRIMPNGLAPIEVDAAVGFTIEKSRIQLTRLRVSSKQIRADVSGTFNNPRAPHGTFNVKANGPIRDLAEMFQWPIAHTGNANFDGQLNVSFDTPFQFGMNGRLNVRGLGYARDRLNIENADGHADVKLTPDSLTMNNLALTALGANIAGTAALNDWSRFHFDGTVDNLTVRDAAKIVTDRAIPWDGMLAGAVNADAVLGQPVSKVTATIAVTPVAGGQPIEGEMNASYDQAAGTLHLAHSHIATRATNLQVDGTLGESLAVQAQSTNLDDLLPALAMAEENAPKELPVKLVNGRATFNGTIAGELDAPRAAGQMVVEHATVDGHAFDHFSGDVNASRQRVHVDRLNLARGTTVVEGTAEIDATAGSFDDGGITARLNVRGAQIGELAKEANLKTSIMGTASASVQLSGTVRKPDAQIALDVDKPAGYGEQLDHLRANVHYSTEAIDVAAGEGSGPAGKLNFQGAYQHRDGDWKNGTARFEVTAQNVAPSAIQAYAKLQTTFDSKLTAKARGTARVANGELTITSLDGDAQARGISWDRQPLGDASLTAETHGTDVNVRASAKVRDITVDAQGTWSLNGDNPGSATVRFSRADVATLHSVVMAGTELGKSPLPFEGFLDGASATLSADLRKPQDFRAVLTINTMQIDPKPTQTLRLGVQSQDVVLKNSQPIVIAMTSKEARIQSAQFIARDTSLAASGSIPFDPKASADVAVRGSVNLIILQLLNPDLAARGNATVQASVRGSLRDPQLSGRMELKNASLYLGDLPNGIDNANGALVFDRNRATIEKLTAETGGGTVDLGGFIGFGSPLVYRLQAVAQKVRVRYPEDVSMTFNATLALNGTSDASTVSGLITLNRASFTPRADIAQILAATARPVSTPTTDSQYIRGMQFDVRIESGPNFELQTSLARNLEAEVDLRLRGTPLRPALIGTFSVNEGEVQVFGNRYTVDRGDVRFVNPVKIDPIFDMNLETKARGVTVNIAISGTLQKLNVNYSSDPPMQPREIIALLAVGRAPTDTAGLTTDQGATSSTSLAEAGGGLIGQAISAQLSSRLQRFFGASRVKIDPTLTGVDYLPQARLTIEQQVSKDITLTYITNLNRTQEQIVQIEWDFSRQWSAVAVREANGLFGIDFQYKKRFK